MSQNDLFSQSDKKGKFSFLKSKEASQAPLVSASDDPNKVWKILVVDDEADIHSVTKLALKDFSFDGRTIQFLHAYSGAGAREILERHPDVAVALVDVVMETSHAGLDLVDFIRTECRNNFTRLILRTGQPGEAPELKVIQDYQIDDYKLKTDLTRDKLFSVILASLRTYEAMMQVESYRLHLDEKVQERTREIQEKNILLEEQKNKLQDLNQLKNKLFSIIAHDLRSPFATFKTLVDMFTDEFLTFEELQEMLPQFQSNFDSTLGLLDNLLSWAGNQLDGAALKPSGFKLEGLLEENINLYLPVAEKKEIKLLKSVSDSVSVYLDRDMIKLVIRNLLSNAIKFTPMGGTVTLSMICSESKVQVSVQDTGAGMSEETISKLFQIKGYSTRGTEGEAGTGLGLALCKDFTEKHQGQIGVQSEVGKGSVFTVTLPLKV